MSCGFVACVVIGIPASSISDMIQSVSVESGPRIVVVVVVVVVLTAAGTVLIKFVGVLHFNGIDAVGIAVVVVVVGGGGKGCCGVAGGDCCK